jgi:F-type H+-transporting ATPase subunit epsilon
MLDLTIYRAKGLKDDIKADNITIDTKMGQVGIFPDHMKLLTVLKVGRMEVEYKRKAKVFAIASGILKVNKNIVDIFTYAIEEKSQIDRKRAKKAKDRAEEYIKKAKHGNKHIDLSRAKFSFLKAINRIKVANN